MSNVTLGGNPIDVAGRFPQAGDAAPAFKLAGADLADVGLDAFAGKRKVLSIVPSLDTPVCAASARKFNTDASALADTVVLVISADLPFAAKRFCEAEGLCPGLRCRHHLRPARRCHRPCGGGARCERQGAVFAARARDQGRARLRRCARRIEVIPPGVAQAPPQY